MTILITGATGFIGSHIAERLQAAGHTLRPIVRRSSDRKWVRRGIDVHVEKPLSLTIREGRAMVEAARRYDRVFQTGSEARSMASCRFACELVRNGRIGKVQEVYVSGVGGPSSMTILPAEPVPPELDWDRWLGPAPKAPYHPDRVHFNFRWCRDYAGGYMTDWGVHMLNVVTFAMDID